LQIIKKIKENLHDDEKALTKAIDSVFPASKRSLCNKHLKDNVSDYLKNKIGVNTKDRVNIVVCIDSALLFVQVFAELPRFLKFKVNFGFRVLAKYLQNCALLPSIVVIMLHVLHGMVKLQPLDMQRALYNIGNFRIFGVIYMYII
jgi:hypothetical protein